MRDDDDDQQNSRREFYSTDEQHRETHTHTHFLSHHIEKIQKRNTKNAEKRDFIFVTKNIVFFF